MTIALPSYEEIFGDLDFSAGDQYRSVLSPAAYLVDIMNLKDWDWDGDDIVDDRREDIARILLNAENTLTEIPYLDVVNEVMETNIEKLVPGEDKAYKILSEADYPLNLPFNLGNSESNIHLDYFKTTPAEFYRTFVAQPDPVITARQLLRLSPEEFDKITTPAAAGTIKSRWGLPETESIASLSDADTFIAAAGIAAMELQELIYQNLSNNEIDNDPSLCTKFFINNSGGSYLVIDKDSTDGKNKLKLGPRVEGAYVAITEDDWAYFDRMNRFIRIARAAGLSFTDCDCIVMNGCGGVLDANALCIIAAAKALMDEYEIPADELCAFWGAIKDYGKGNDSTPDDLFNRLFNNGYEKPISDPDFDETEKSRSERDSRIQGAIGVTSDEYTSITTYLGTAGSSIAYTSARLAMPYRIARIALMLDISIGDFFKLVELIDANWSSINEEKFRATVPFRRSTTTAPSDCASMLARYSDTSAPTADQTADTLWLVQTLAAMVSWLADSDITVEELRYICTGNYDGAEEGILSIQERMDFRTELNLQLEATLLNAAYLQSGITDAVAAQALFTAMNQAPVDICSETGILKSQPAAETLKVLYTNVLLKEKLRKEKLSLAVDDFATLEYTENQFNLLMSELITANYVDSDYYLINKNIVLKFFLDPGNAASIAIPSGSSFYAQREDIFTILAAKTSSYTTALIEADPARSYLLVTSGDLASLNLNTTELNDLMTALYGSDFTEFGSTTTGLYLMDTYYYYFSDSNNKSSFSLGQQFSSDTMNSLFDIIGVQFNAYKNALAVSSECTAVAEKIADLAQKQKITVFKALESRMGVPFDTASLLVNALFVMADESDGAAVAQFIESYNSETYSLPQFEGSSHELSDSITRLFQYAYLISITQLTSKETEAIFTGLSIQKTPGSVPNILLNDVRSFQQLKELSLRYNNPDCPIIECLKIKVLEFFTSEETFLDDCDTYKTAIGKGLPSATGWTLYEIANLSATSGILPYPNTYEEVSYDSTIQIVYDMNRIFDHAAQMGAGPAALYNNVWRLMFYEGEIDFTTAAGHLDAFLKSVTAKESWKGLSAELRNKINVKKRDALLGYLIHALGTDPAVSAKYEIKTARDLYEYLLIDVDMYDEYTTSRIQEAHECMQLFYHRMLMSLEDIEGSDSLAKTKALIKDWWYWMKNYRVWEANRKVFLYPENYIRPELRDTKSPAFKKFEEALLQEDITEENVQKRFKEYLDDFTELSRMKIAGGYAYQTSEEIEGSEDTIDEKWVTFFGHTITEPRKYYFMSGEILSDSSIAWQPWNEIGFPVNAGRVYPVYAFNRLFIFWTEITEENVSELSASSKFSPDTQKVRYKPVIYYSFHNLNGIWATPQKLVDVTGYVEDLQWDLDEETQTLKKSASNNNYANIKKLFIDDNATLDTRPSARDRIYNAGLVVSNISMKKIYDTNELIYLLYKIGDGTTSLTIEGALNSDLNWKADSDLIDEDTREILNFNAPFPDDKLGGHSIDAYIPWQSFFGNVSSSPWFSFGEKGGNFLCKPLYIPEPPSPSDSITLGTPESPGSPWTETDLTDTPPTAGFDDGIGTTHLFFDKNVSDQYLYKTYDQASGVLTDMSDVYKTWGYCNPLGESNKTVERAVTIENTAYLKLSDNGYMIYDSAPVEDPERNSLFSPAKTIILDDNIDTADLVPAVSYLINVNVFNVQKCFTDNLSGLIRVVLWDSYVYLIFTTGKYVKLSFSLFWLGMFSKLPVAKRTNINQSTSPVDAICIHGQGPDRQLYITTGTRVVTYNLDDESCDNLPISTLWQISTTKINALLSGNDGKLYMFAGDTCYERDTATVSYPHTQKWGFLDALRDVKISSAVKNGDSSVALFYTDTVDGRCKYVVHSNAATSVASGPRLLADLVPENDIKSKFSENSQDTVSINTIAVEAVFTRSRSEWNSIENQLESPTSTYCILTVNATVAKKKMVKVLQPVYANGSWWLLWVNKWVTTTSETTKKLFVRLSTTDIGTFACDTGYPQQMLNHWSNVDTVAINNLYSIFTHREKCLVGPPDNQSEEVVNTFYIVTFDGTREEGQEYQCYKYIQEENFPKETQEEDYEIIRLSSNTWQALNQKLLANGTDGLLSLEVQKVTRDLPGFTTIPADENNDTILYDPSVICKVPNWDEVNNLPEAGLDFESVNGQYYWEIFFHAPFLIAQALNNQQKFEEAKNWYEYIFDPTEQNALDEAPYWKFYPFLADIENTIFDDVTSTAQLKRYMDDPFDPHAIAALRQVAYRKAIVMNYIDNLIDRGDMLFTQYTRESINEARMLYVLAYDLLGKKPEKTGTLRLPDEMDYTDLRSINESNELDIVLIENMPYNADIRMRMTLTPNDSILGSYFFIPENELFIQYWDRIEDRLFKIRHSLDMEGVKRALPLFEPPIDVMALVRAVGSGQGLAQALADFSVAVPHYRFSFMLARAKELAQRVSQLGGSLLSALEKKDAEELALLRNTHEKKILEITLDIKKAQLEEANASLTSLQANLMNAKTRENYYAGLIAMGLSPFELGQNTLLQSSIVISTVSQAINSVASLLYGVPNVGSPFAMTFGGIQLGNIMTATAGALGAASSVTSGMANLTSIQGGYYRRRQDWTLQLNLAKCDVKQIEHQIAAAEIRVKIAEKEIDVAKKNMEHNESIDTFMKGKFTSKQLYQWMAGRLSAVYFQTYHMALDYARAAQQAFRFELGFKESEVGFVTALYWDSLKKGLLAGESLTLDLDRMEKAFYEKNRRRFEITKTVSLAQIDPVALLELKHKRACEFSLFEELFDYDFPGHYRRQIKAISITIPAVVGPYENVNATLTQLGNRILLEPDKKGVEWLLAHDSSLQQPASIRGDWRSNQQIALSRGVNDAGLFQLNFQDERYLPFEGTGAVSTWRLELNGHIGAFDVNSLSDVIIRIEYTAMQGGDAFAGIVKKKLRARPAARLFNLSQDFSAEWNAFMETPANGMTFTVTKEMFPGIGSSSIEGLYMHYETTEQGAEALNGVGLAVNSLGTLMNDSSLSVSLAVSENGVAISLVPTSATPFTTDNIRNIALAFVYQSKFDV